ncbi:hypothetical protein FHETE_5332 [Fusarium heterosporum]|uniref:Uncharacterized protein n=1 Tax=Fusarium heterosporum TaxID=42747 RepID=A0A8H5TBE1_FUSHE|nr:hypothetical protein FHETE_5332 [Fusarium heterosporum]
MTVAKPEVHHVGYLGRRDKLPGIGATVVSSRHHGGHATSRMVEKAVFLKVGDSLLVDESKSFTARSKLGIKGSRYDPVALPSKSLFLRPLASGRYWYSSQNICNDTGVVGNGLLDMSVEVKSPVDYAVRSWMKRECSEVLATECAQRFGLTINWSPSASISSLEHLWLRTMFDNCILNINMDSDRHLPSLELLPRHSPISFNISATISRVFRRRASRHPEAPILGWRVRQDEQNLDLNDRCTRKEFRPPG